MGKSVQKQTKGLEKQPKLQSPQKKVAFEKPKPLVKSSLKRPVSQIQESKPNPPPRSGSPRLRSSVLESSSFNNCSQATFRSTTRITEERFKKPSQADREKANEVTAKVIGKLDLGDMHVPINNESLMNTRYTSIVPFHS